jgi:hypothetical protein
MATMISGAEFVSLITLPDVITQPGQYFTRAGEVVTVRRVSAKHDFGCRGIYSTGQADGWHKSGRLYFGILSDNDIVRPA